MGETAVRNYGAMVQAAMGSDGFEPYDYQRRIAEDGLPELLDVPTGAGKTAAIILGWLWRRRFHPDKAVRDATPAKLVMCLPMRVLVDQTIDVSQDWLDRLGLGDALSVYSLMGGEPLDAQHWRTSPHGDAIFVGTLDMLLSRALNRGYGASRFSWPIDFALLNSGCHWVFDEVQLMGVALETSRQLEGLRRSLGTVNSCSSTWMSATVDPSRLLTIDNDSIDETAVVRLSEADRNGGLATRLNGTRRIEEVTLPDKSREAALADTIVDAHTAGTLSIAVMNTVDAAADLFHHLQRVTEVDCVLLHSRFRPIDRRAAITRALGPVNPSGPGRVVVSTQVIEAGVDISADLMFTEAAPWPSIVQRAGRCNRDGLASNARLLWAPPRKPPPYDQVDVDRTVDQLRVLAGDAVTPETLSTINVKTEAEILPVLRRRDLIDLFDTSPDMSGNDVDVSRFIRVDDDLDAVIAWRALDGDAPEQHRLPSRDERCTVPLTQLREFAKTHHSRVWVFDHLDSRWRGCGAADVRPGALIVADSAAGGYDPVLGWSPKSTTSVPPISGDLPAFELADGDLSTDDDPMSLRRRWVSLDEHLGDVAEQATMLVAELPPDALNVELTDSVITAAHLHDIGKVHPAFQAMLRSTAAGDDAELGRAAACGEPWAKSGGPAKARSQRRHFRHELASALALLNPECTLLAGSPEPDLVRYLVAAHHGRVRLSIRSQHDEERDGSGRIVALGVIDGEILPAFSGAGIDIGATPLDLSTMSLGREDDGTPSWTERALRLRDRADLGPFRLAYLEMLVRIADWRASAMEEPVR